ncbi:MAG TPA: cupin domain-containing protein [Phycisphaerae bacterium]|nr:cupin domain-containing protein [Phycisphaerae bacterium]
MQDQDVEQSITELGAKLSAFRSSRGWTLDELAERSGLSKAQLSRLESAERQPSLAALLSLAQAFGISVASFFEFSQSDQGVQIVRSAAGSPQQANGLTYWPLSTGTNRFNLQPIRVVVSPDRPGDDLYHHDGEEWLMVISGRVRLSVGAQTHTLEPGDSAHFDSRIGHRLDALDSVDAEVIVVACPLEALPRITVPRPAGQRVPRGRTNLPSG